MASKNPGGYIGEATNWDAPKRPRKGPRQRAVEYASRHHPGPSPTWDGAETRNMLAAAWLAGYRAHQREESRHA